MTLWFAVQPVAASQAGPQNGTATRRTFLPSVARPVPLTAEAQVELAMVNAINQQRAANGLPALAISPALTLAARRHSTDMAARNFFSHTGSDGSTPATRMQAAGYTGTWVGENIGAGYSGDVNRMVAAWMGSEGHRSNILSASFTEIGAGYVRLNGTRYTFYFTTDFGRPR